jgi:NAD(P)H-dependent flavin oxidoreductase YrpB (nitropropane dioxygenase family)
MSEFSIGGLKIKLPIVQGGMGVGISLSGLASAVAGEGGVGVISCAGIGLLYRHLSNDFYKASVMGLKEEIARAREKAKGVIGVNIMVALTNFSDMVRASLSAGADIIFSGAGLPLDLPSYLSPGCSTKLVPIVSSGRAAKLICDKWMTNYNYMPDAFVLEGPLAGGHLGYKERQIEDEKYSLDSLLPELLEAIKPYEQSSGRKIPVIAAGGIYDGRQMRKYLDMGASAVQLGTRFVTTDECDASVEFKNAYINSHEGDIKIIKSPVGMPGRAIDSPFLSRVKMGLEKPLKCPFKCIKSCNFKESPYCIIMALYNAFKGNLQKGYAFAGDSAYRAEKITSVKETIMSLMKEMKE